ncbi:Major Facilitator Superfamily (MFS) transporter [Phytophthora megakarya]|uniref:Major Facilitator Superfamily (MFS) transporter n=1 Tax=Phytophthora megakarya TaxID=4795 RepID=A0A225WNP6_9STRA|nr:Major Facilitator Superfamily (MFS) transporter [Phytophthora megakarya]
MLAILSVLSSINQAICYSYAPIDSIVEARWDERIRSEHLITIYFISYIPCSFIGSWLMDKFGLRFGVLLGAFLQAGGASLRYFACSFDSAEEPYITFLGQLLASLAMPFMVNSPPVLSANWFPSYLRAASTSVAVSADQLGAAIVYLVAPFVVRSTDEVPFYNFCVMAIAGAAFVIALLFFRSYPKPGDDHFVAAKSHLEDDYDWSQWANAFRHSGFWHTVVAFSVAECVLNAMCALLNKFLSAANFSTTQVGIFGAVFIVSSLIGSQIISRYVDEKRDHKMALQICLLLVGVGITLFRLLPKTQIHATLFSLLFLGFVLGPLQPIALELGVECAFPTSAATVAALQQLCGNFLSAIVVPTLSTLLRTHLSSNGDEISTTIYSSPELIMVMMTTTTFIIVCFL